jgi:hypothetical protein
MALSRKNVAVKSIVAGALITALPLVDAYPGEMPGIATDKSIVIRILPKIGEFDTPESMIMRISSEKMAIILPSGYVEENKASVDSMKKAVEDNNRQVEAMVSKAGKSKQKDATAVCIAAQDDPGQISTWLERRSEAFRMMSPVFPKSLENDYGAKKGAVALEPPEGVDLGAYQDYVKKSIGIACVFLYKEKWKQTADAVAAGINWGKVRSNIGIMTAMRDGKGKGSRTIRPAKGIEMTISVDKRIIRGNLSDQYLAMVAVLADAMEQLTGVERNTLLALGTRETGMDHNNFNRITKDRGIMQLNRNSPLFTYVAYDTPKRGSKKELENVMDVVLPEKNDFDRARIMVAGLFNAIDVMGDDKQGDITMNMIAGALTYRYKYFLNTGEGRLDYSGISPYMISYHRASVEDYNGSEAKRAYAKAVEKYWLQFKRAADIASDCGALPLFE